MDLPPDEGSEALVGPTYRVAATEHCWIPLPDGSRLSARLWLPEMPGHQPTPAILEYIPYRKRDMVRLRDERNHPVFAAHGYACVRVDMRGSGDSEGTMADMYSPEELDDAVAVIDWIAAQPWCDGSVGMMGTSWGGTSSLQAASRRPKALKAVIAVASTSNRFDDDIHHMGGCLLTDTVEWGATLPAILALPPDPETVGPNWRQLWMKRLEGLSFPLENWVRHEANDSYWRFGSVAEAPNSISCPLLLIAGWIDRYSNTVMQLLASCHSRSWGVVGPWGHHFPDQASPGPGLDFQKEALRWWDRWLKGIDNGVEQEPRLRVWQQDYQPPCNFIDRREGRWISEADWPSPNVTQTTYGLSNGALQACAVSKPSVAETKDSAVQTLAVRLGVGAASGDTGYFGRPGGLPLAQDREDQASLIFETSPLEDDLEVLGSASLSLSLADCAPKGQVTVRLVDVPDQGAGARIAYAVRNLSLDEEGRPWLPPQEAAARRLNVVFPHASYRLAKGHRLRLCLSGAYWPQIWPSSSSAELKVQLPDCRLSLPLRKPHAKEQSTAETAPRFSIEGPRQPSSNTRLERFREVDEGLGTSRLGWRQPFTVSCFPEIDLEFGYETMVEHSIDLNDPSSAATRCRHRFRMSRGNWQVEVNSEAELTCNTERFFPRGAVEVYENGALLFERRWDTETPRTLS